MKHSRAENYFDFATPAKSRHVELCRSAFVAAGIDNDQRIDNYPANSMFHDLSSETGPVLMSNHTNNDQKWRLYEGKSGKKPVIGPETFPNLTIDLERFETYSQDFEKGLIDSLKSAFGSFIKAIKRRRIAR
jgi:hypothetical protein